jgi:hypothetical protein
MEVCDNEMGREKGNHYLGMTCSGQSSSHAFQLSRGTQHRFTATQLVLDMALKSSLNRT